MRTIRVICFFAALGMSAVALAADPAGIWKWTTRSGSNPIETTLKLELKDGKLAGAYANQFGETAIRNVTLQDDVIAFEVVRDLGGNKYVVKYRGKVEGDSIKGTIEAPGHDGSGALKLDWDAKRTPSETGRGEPSKG